MDKAPQVRLHSTSQLFSRRLNDIGVEYLFSQLSGTDQRPAHRGDGALEKDGRRYPKVLNCPHENTAMQYGGATPWRRPRTGGDGARGRGQAIPRWRCTTRAAGAAAGAYGGEAPYTRARRVARIARHYVHFTRSRSSQSGIVAALRQVGMDAALGVMTKETLRRAHTGGAQRSHGPGLPHAPARDVDTDLGRGGDAPVPA